MKTLLKIAALYRCLQLFGHCAHNVTKGCTFFADHEFFGDTYAAYEVAYDAVIERLLGFGVAVNFSEVTSVASGMFVDAWSKAVDVQSMLAALQEGEAKLRELVEAAVKEPGMSQGTINMLADLADQSEIRSYKLGMRVA